MHYLEEERHDGLDALKTKMEAEDCVAIATIDGLKVADVGEGEDAGTFVKRTEDVADEHWGGKQGLDDVRCWRGSVLK